MVTKKKSQDISETLIEGVRSSLDEAEQLLRDAADASGDKASELRERALRSLRESRVALHDTQEAFIERGKRAAEATDHYVHSNPWQAIGVAGVVGLLLGVLVGRR